MSVDVTMSVAKNVKRLRLQTSLSQAKFGRLIGKDQRMVCNWESGDSFPLLSDVARMCEILNISADEIVIGSDGRSAADIEAQRSVWKLAREHGWVAVYGRITGLMPATTTTQEPTADDTPSPTLRMPAPKHEPVSVPERQPITGEPLTVKSPKKGRSRKSS